MSKPQIIQDFLDQNNIKVKVLEFKETTRTSQDAANQAGCELARIAKSIIFKTGDEPILIITSGPNKVSEQKLKTAIQSRFATPSSQSSERLQKASQDQSLRIEKADAEFVYEKTGFPIGGVPAFCHKTQIRFIFIDEDLLKFDKVWSAAGTPNAIFEIGTKDLIRLSGAIIVDIKT